jgi:hypothetical protein
MKSFVIASSVLLLAFSSASARTWHVMPDGTGDVPTIQAGVDSCGSGDTLLLASGTYRGAGNVKIQVPGEAILIVSETSNPTDCVIDCEGYLGGTRYGFRFLFGEPGPVVRGIMVMNSNSPAVRSSGSETLRNCWFSNNGVVGPNGCGGAISVTDGFPLFTNCMFMANYAWHGEAIAVSGVVTQATVDSCEFYDNEAADGGAICCDQHGASLLLRNSLLYYNSAAEAGGGIIIHDMEVNIEGCTIAHNTAPVGSGIYAELNIGVSSCIVASNTGGNGYQQSD